MTELLERAFREAAKLPPEEQNRVAAQLLQELADEALWEEKFTQSAPLLEKLAAEALEEHRKGLTSELGFDEL